MYCTLTAISVCIVLYACSSHGAISRAEAERLLASRGLEVGLHLVRSKGNKSFVLTVCVDADAPAFANHVLQPTAQGFTINGKGSLALSISVCLCLPLSISASVSRDFLGRVLGLSLKRFILWFFYVGFGDAGPGTAEA